MSIHAVTTSHPTPATTARTAGVATAAAAPAAPPQASNRAAVQKAVTFANIAMRSLSNSLEFSLDPESGKTVVRVVDSATQEIIRQIPSEEMMSIARVLDRLRGLLLNQQA